MKKLGLYKMPVTLGFPEIPCENPRVFIKALVKVLEFVSAKTLWLLQKNIVETLGYSHYFFSTLVIFCCQKPLERTTNYIYFIVLQ